MNKISVYGKYTSTRDTLRKRTRLAVTISDDFTHIIACTTRVVWVYAAFSLIPLRL